MIYNIKDPDSLFWTFLITGRRGRYLTTTQQIQLTNRKGAARDDGYGGGAGDG
jgi:hypothetical protein